MKNKSFSDFSSSGSRQTAGIGDVTVKHTLPGRFKQTKPTISNTTGALMNGWSFHQSAWTLSPTGPALHAITNQVSRPKKPKTVTSPVTVTVKYHQMY